MAAGGHAAAAFQKLRDRQLADHDHERVREEDQPDRALPDPVVVLGERRKQVLQLGETGRDQERVEDEETEENAVAQHPRVAGGAALPQRSRRCM